MEFLSILGAVMSLNHWLVLAMFVVFIIMLFRGIPVVFALVGVSLIFALLGEALLDPARKAINEYIEFDRTGITYQKLSVVAGRFFGGTIKNPVLVALPMFIFMGLMLDQSGVAQRMMKSMQVLFGALKGGHFGGLDRGDWGVGGFARGDGHSDDDETGIRQANCHWHHRRIRHVGHPDTAVDHAGDHVGSTGDQSG